MSENKRFVVGIHALTALAVLDGETVSSDRLAWSANMNAAAVRRVLSQLRDADLVRSKPGPSGGFALNRAPEEITLLDVYLAVGLGPPFRADQNDPNDECPIGTNMEAALTTAFEPVETALYDALDAETLADVVSDVQARIEAEYGDVEPRTVDPPFESATDTD
jgi:Rrf2 family protein